MVEKEQLRVQLESMQSRITEHADTMAVKMAEDRRFVRQEMQAEKDELELKVYYCLLCGVNRGSI